MNRIHGQKNSASERTWANIEGKGLTVFSGTVAVPLREGRRQPDQATFTGGHCCPYLWACCVRNIEDLMSERIE